MTGSSMLRATFAAVTLWTLAAASHVGAADRDPPAASDPVSDLMDRRYDDLRRSSSASGDLRLRILFSQQLRVVDDATTFVDVIPLATLLDAARGSTDPLVLQLLLGRCRDAGTEDACDAVALARRWTQADAQNQAAWIESATLLERQGDVVGAARAWDSAGRASTTRDPSYDYARLVIDALPVDRDPRLRHLDLLFAVDVAAAVPTPWMFDVTQGCRDAARRRTCAHLADVGFRDATTFAALHVARSLAATTGESSTVLAGRQRTEQALLWAQGRLMEAMDFVTFEPRDDAAWSRANAILQDRIARGEIAPARDALRAERLSDADGAARYASSLGATPRVRPAP